MPPDESSQEQEAQVEEPQPASPSAFLSEPEGDGDSDESGSDSECPIEGLLGKRLNEDGGVEYEVQWSGPCVPTWEPESHVSAVSIAEYEKNEAAKAKIEAAEAKNEAAEAKKGKAKPPKKKQTKTSTGNRPVTRSATKAMKSAK